MKRILPYLFYLSFSFGCHKTIIEPNNNPAEHSNINTQKQEVEATIVRFDGTKYICGFSWIIQVGAKQCRAKTVSESFQKDNQPVRIKYEELPNDGTNCGFIVLTAIRIR